jgi:hypothetical protein
MPLPPHYVRVGPVDRELKPDSIDPVALRRDVEPWLAAVLQSEHLGLLLGSGLSIAVASLANATPARMTTIKFGAPDEEAVNRAAELHAKRAGNGTPNIEDQLRAALQLVDGLEILGRAKEAEAWRRAIGDALDRFVKSILEMEREIALSVGANEEAGLRALETLVSFLLTFASRAASRDRLNVFTTNYDRVLEFGFDAAGIRALDRFVGALSPVFRASRLDLDVHYNPPGMRGEPRYLEGVVRLTKLHGSLDWRYQDGQIRRGALPFGASGDTTDADSYSSLIIFPNPAKDLETLQYPYAELFRDLAAAICRPNSALVTYGYGFGDDHVNRILADMLVIPSTHLVVISRSDEGGRLGSFLSKAGHPQQVSLLVGEHLGDITNLTQFYLPRPAIDAVTLRRADILRKRDQTTIGEPEPEGDDAR